jgi:hypothetical protein
MFPYPGLPQHLQGGRTSKSLNKSALPFSRSCWSILPTRVVQHGMLFPLLGVQGKCSSASGPASSAEENKTSGFVIQTMFATSPLLEHGIVEGVSAQLITSCS